MYPAANWLTRSSGKYRYEKQRRIMKLLNKTILAVLLTSLLLTGCMRDVPEVPEDTSESVVPTETENPGETDENPPETETTPPESESELKPSLHRKQRMKQSKQSRRMKIFPR